MRTVIYSDKSCLWGTVDWVPHRPSLLGTLDSGQGLSFTSCSYWIQTNENILLALQGNLLGMSGYKYFAPHAESLAFVFLHGVVPLQPQFGCVALWLLLLKVGLFILFAPFCHAILNIYLKNYIHSFPYVLLFSWNSSFVFVSIFTFSVFNTCHPLDLMPGCYSLWNKNQILGFIFKQFWKSVKTCLYYPILIILKLGLLQTFSIIQL